MDAGQLDHRVIFQQAVMIRDPDGMLIQGWEDRFPQGAMSASCAARKQ